MHKNVNERLQCGRPRFIIRPLTTKFYRKPQRKREICIRIRPMMNKSHRKHRRNSNPRLKVIIRQKRIRICGPVSPSPLERNSILITLPLMTSKDHLNILRQNSELFIIRLLRRMISHRSEGLGLCVSRFLPTIQQAAALGGAPSVMPMWTRVTVALCLSRQSSQCHLLTQVDIHRHPQTRADVTATLHLREVLHQAQTDNRSTAREAPLSESPSPRILNRKTELPADIGRDALQITRRHHLPLAAWPLTHQKTTRMKSSKRKAESRAQCAPRHVQSRLQNLLCSPNKKQNTNIDTGKGSMIPRASRS